MTDVDTLARTIYGEARGEPDPGMAAVAWVVKNRAAHPGWWGASIAGCCLAHEQFSCWNPKDPNRSKILNVTPADDPYFAKALDIAAKVVSGALPDPTHGAASYYERHMDPPPEWAAGRTPCATIGNHIFFTD